MTSGGVLQGGAKRRRRPRRWVLALLVVALVAGGGAAALAFVTGGDDSTVRSGDRAASLEPSVPPHAKQEKEGALPRRPPPGIALSGPNAVRAHLQPNPAAAIMFDV